MSSYVKSNKLTTHQTGNVHSFNVPSPLHKRSNCGPNCSCGTQSTPASEKSVPGYDYMKHLGEGAYGCVELYRKRSTGKKVAIKSMSYNRNGHCAFQEIVSEYQLVMNIIHPNIARYYGFYTNPDRKMCYIVMEYASRGSLLDLLNQQRRKREFFVVRTALRMIRDVIMGVQFLNSKHVLHCDLKPGNILLGDDNLLKISDFGLASLNYDVKSNIWGTTPYIAPEQFDGAKQNEKTEIWSIGIIAYEICQLEHPFNGFSLTTGQLNQKVRNGGFKPLHPSYGGSDLQNMIETMLHREPEQRGTLNSHLKNKIFQF